MNETIILRIFFANNDADDNVGYNMLARMILRFFY